MGHAYSLYCDDRAAIAQLGERQTEDLKVPGSIPGLGIFSMSSAVVRGVFYHLMQVAMIQKKK